MDRYLLDTNVVSEARKGGRADPGVTTWLASVRGNQLHISVLVLGEIRQGVERLQRRGVTASRSPAISTTRAEACPLAHQLQPTAPGLARQSRANLTQVDPPAVASAPAAPGQIEMAERGFPERCDHPVVHPTPAGDTAQ
jgi:hypothetical protein